MYCRRFAALVFGFLCCFAVASVGQERNTLGYEDVKAIFANHTAMSYDSAHGTQVEYISPNGKTYLLYPGNTTIVKGDWKLTRTDEPGVFNMCFRYPSTSYNPATGKAGGDWECQIAGFYFSGLKEIVPSDMLGLSRRSQEVPFVLSPHRTTIANLIAKVIAEMPR